MLILFGSSGGIGSGLVDEYTSDKGFESQCGGYRFVDRRECDLSSELDVKMFWDRIGLEIPPEEPIYVTHAVGRSLNGLIPTLSLESWNTMFRDNVTTCLLLLKYGAHHLHRRPGSSVVFLTSIVARTGVRGASGYAACKSAVNGLAKTAAAEFAPFGTRVNVIEMGYFDRGMISDVPDWKQQEIVKSVPVGRLGTPSDLKTCCDYLHMSPFQTGNIVSLSGGL